MSGRWRCGSWGRCGRLRCSGVISPWTFSPTVPSAAIRSRWCWTPSGLSTAQMQAVATEFNYSETTFVLPPRDAANDAEVRIFTAERRRSRSPAIPMSAPPLCWRRRATTPPAAAEVRGEGAGLVPVEILTGAGQGGRRRTHRAAAAARLSQFSAEQAAACLLAAGGRHQDRPAPAANRLRRNAVPGGGTALARGAAAGAGPTRRLSRAPFPATAAYAVYFYTRDVPPAEQPLRPAGADVLSRRQRPDRGPRHRQRHGGRRRAVRRLRPARATAN